MTIDYRRASFQFTEAIVTPRKLRGVRKPSLLTADGSHCEAGFRRLLHDNFSSLNLQPTLGVPFNHFRVEFMLLNLNPVV